MQPSSKTCASCNDEKPVPDLLPAKFSDDGLTDSYRVSNYGDPEWDRRERGTRVRLERRFVRNTRARARHRLRVWRQSEASFDTSTHGRARARHGLRVWRQSEASFDTSTHARVMRF
jgi:hypothetical protein